MKDQHTEFLLMIPGASSVVPVIVRVKILDRISRGRRTIEDSNIRGHIVVIHVQLGDLEILVVVRCVQ